MNRDDVNPWHDDPAADDGAPRMIALLLAAAGGFAMLLGLLLGVLVATPLNGLHLLAAILVAAGGYVWVCGMRTLIARARLDRG